jgi:hypothetical protein
MHRRAFIAVMGGGILAAPLGGVAQIGKVYRVGVLHFTPDLSRMEAFRNGLSELPGGPA